VNTSSSPPRMSPRSRRALAAAFQAMAPPPRPQEPCVAIPRRVLAEAIGWAVLAHLTDPTHRGPRPANEGA